MKERHKKLYKAFFYLEGYKIIHGDDSEENIFRFGPLFTNRTENLTCLNFNLSKIGIYEVIPPDNIPIYLDCP